MAGKCAQEEFMISVAASKRALMMNDLLNMNG